MPSQLPPNALSLRYTCDRTFTVTNTLDEPIIGTYVVVTLKDTTLNWPLGMDPKTTRTLSMPRSGTVQILENGKVIAEARNEGKACNESKPRENGQTKVD